MAFNISYTHTLFAVLVPRPGTPTTIDTGSAIVCSQEEWEKAQQGALDKPLTVDYEGGRFMPMTYRERVLHAADRQATRYPTVARSWLMNPDRYERVGTYRLDRKELVIDPGKVAALAAWGVSDLDAGGRDGL